jgi:phenylalanyl-tRNA synthetase beta chain
LDGVDRKLGKDDLMICDVNGGMCIGGVFGGIESGVTANTTNLFIESAYFNPVYIRQTARRHGLNTDASFRFERGCDPNNTIYVLKRAAMLIKEIAGGTISSEIIDCYPKFIAPFNVSVRYEKINALIGKEIERETIISILQALDIDVIKELHDGLELQVPTYRVDVQRDVDVIEEILRIYGYNNIVPGETVHSSISYFPKPDNHQLQNLVAEQLTANGFHEIMNNSLTKSGYYDALQTFPPSNLVMMMNPLSSDLNCMRQTLLFGGLESIAYNINRKNTNLRFYEFGNCYFHDANANQGQDLLNAYSEEMHLGLWITGNKTYQSWVRNEEKSTFFELKAYVENSFRRLGILLRKLQQKTISESDWLAEGFVYTTKKEMPLAIIGSVSSSIRKVFDINAEVFMADIYWDNVMREAARTSVAFSDISKFPEVKRDLALLIDYSVQFAEIEKIAYETEKKLLRKVQLFDVYEGKNLPEGKKSYAISFTLQDPTKTLTDKQIDDIMQRLVNQYQDKIGAKLR